MKLWITMVGYELPKYGFVIRVSLFFINTLKSESSEKVERFINFNILRNPMSQ